MKVVDCLQEGCVPTGGVIIRVVFGVGLALGISVMGSSCARFSHAPVNEGPAPALTQERVTWDEFNPDWLASAIFKETNRVRRAFDLPAFAAQRKLAGAADLQATTIALTGVVSHHNPLAGRANVMDRVRAQGIMAAAAWENVASSLVRASPDGGPVRISINEHGRRIRLNDETGEVLTWPTYADLARRIVQQWMDSPPHRNNILNPEASHSACGAALSRSPLGAEVVHSVQVFIAKP